MVFQRDRSSRLLEEQNIGILLTSSSKNFEYFADFRSHMPGPIYDFEYLHLPNLYFVGVPMEKTIEPFLVCCNAHEMEMAFEESPIKDRKFYPKPRGFLSSGKADYSKDPYEAISKAMVERGLEDSRIGLEMDYESMTTEVLPIEVYERLKKVLPKAKFMNGSKVIRELRVIKSDEEIARMKRAAQIAEKATRAAFESAHIGVKELELEKVILNTVAEEVAKDRYESLRFEKLTINFYPSKFKLTGGQHLNVATEHRLEKGDKIKIDHACSYKLYLNDMCRSFCVEKPDPRVEKYWGAVLETNRAVANEIRAGVTCGELYDVYYKTMKEKTGLVKAPVGHVGHGVGLSLHELPYLAMDDPTPLEPGMTITDEIGMWVDGLGSFSLEDEMVVTKNGYEPITTLSRELNY